MLDKRRRWKFIINEDRSWAWRKLNPNGTESRSSRAFKSLEECMADARSHGYVVRTAKDRRAAS